MKIYALIDGLLKHLAASATLAAWSAEKELPLFRFYRDCPDLPPGTDEAPFVYLAPASSGVVDWAGAPENLAAKALTLRLIVGLVEEEPQAPALPECDRVYLGGIGPELEAVTKLILSEIEVLCAEEGIPLDAAASTFETTDYWPLILTDTDLAFAYPATAF